MHLYIIRLSTVITASICLNFISGCAKSIDVITDNNARPFGDVHADFSAKPLTGTCPLTVQFADLSSGENITMWEWDFDNDGIIDSMDQSPTHTYEIANSYTVFLRVTDSNDSDTEIKADYIEATARKVIEKYAIVASDVTINEWSSVIANLQTKYPQSKLFEYTSWSVDKDNILNKLSEFFPKYVCFVERPPVSRSFVQSVIAFMRDLDDDPYADAIWSILTGYNLSDAERISNAAPLTVSNGCSHVGSGWLQWFDAGVSWNEGTQYDKYIKTSGNSVQQVDGPGNTTSDIVDELNKDDKHCMSSSGHATEHVWEMGYSYYDGILSSNGGRVYGDDRNGNIYEITTTNPKIYYSPGNCLIAHQSDMDSMSLAWMHSGVNAFFGHVINQMRTCTAWGIAQYFFSLQDQFTYAEAVYVNRVGSMYINDFGWERCLNGTVLYGDPAWKCKMARSTQPLWNQSLTVQDNGDGDVKIAFEVTFNQDWGPGNHPPVAILPERIMDPIIVSADTPNVVITDNFVLMHLENAASAGEVYRVVFTAVRR